MNNDPNLDCMAEADRVSVLESAALSNVFGAMALFAGDRISTAVESETGLNGITVSALVSIAHAPGESIDFLATTLRRSHSTVVRLVGGLVDQGLVSRGSGVDARVVSLELTRSGKQMVRKALASRVLVLDELLSKLDPVERDTLETLSWKLISSNVEDEAHALWICRLCDGEVCDPCPMVAVFGDD